MSDTGGPAHAPGVRAPVPGPSRQAVVAMARAVVLRPDLWWTALGALRRLAAPRWWSSWPRLPMPDGRLWAFRMVTAYGTPDRVPDPGDVIAYLEWCRSTAPSGRLRRGVGVPPARPGRRAGPGSG